MTPLRFAPLAGLLLLVPPCPGANKGDCPAGFVWSGDRCLVQDCTHARVDAFCLMDDGTTGNCFGDTCRTVEFGSNDNCGQFGVTCPKGQACEEPYQGTYYCGTSPTAINYACDANTVCPDGYTCTIGDCVLNKCDGDSTTDKACVASNSFGYIQTGVCCGNVCVASSGFPLQDSAPIDNHYCGGCGIDCGTGSCQASYQGGIYQYGCVPRSCEGKNDGAACFTGTQNGSCCDGKCSTLQGDTNCGACGLNCPKGTTCSYGLCVENGNTGCTSTSCPTGWTCLFSYYCVPDDCTGLPDSATCSPDGVSYDSCCNGQCINFYSNDPKNCGACGRVCDDGFSCSFGTCVAKVDCKDNADGTPCATNNGVYSSCCEGKCKPAGSCGTACKKGDVQNGYYCYNSDGGIDFCSTDSDCPAGFGCVYGICYQTKCPSKDFDNAPCAVNPTGAAASTYGTCCGGACTNPYADNNNCGGCNITCPANETCNGSCVAANQFYTPCPADGSGCGDGRACIYTGCYPTSCKGSDDGLSCAYGNQNGYFFTGTCCDGKCISQYQDAKNCGSCGTKCDSGQTCSGGYCSNNTCTPACTHGQVCSNGICVASVCDPQYVSYYYAQTCAADDGTVGQCCSNGACEEILSDPQNCGGCGIQCPEGQTCNKGTCSGTADICGPNNLYAFCDLKHGLGSICCPGVGCTDISSDANNCGSCGNKCSEGQLCQSNACSAPAQPGAGGNVH